MLPFEGGGVGVGSSVAVVGRRLAPDLPRVPSGARAMAGALQTELLVAMLRAAEDELAARSEQAEASEAMRRSAEAEVKKRDRKLAALTKQLLAAVAELRAQEEAAKEARADAATLRAALRAATQQLAAANRKANQAEQAVNAERLAAKRALRGPPPPAVRRGEQAAPTYVVNGCDPTPSSAVRQSADFIEAGARAAAEARAAVADALSRGAARAEAKARAQSSRSDDAEIRRWTCDAASLCSTEGAADVIVDGAIDRVTARAESQGNARSARHAFDGGMATVEEGEEEGGEEEGEEEGEETGGGDVKESGCHGKECHDDQYSRAQNFTVDCSELDAESPMPPHIAPSPPLFSASTATSRAQPMSTNGSRAPKSVSWSDESSNSSIAESVGADHATEQRLGSEGCTRTSQTDHNCLGETPAELDRVEQASRKSKDMAERLKNIAAFASRGPGPQVSFGPPCAADVPTVRVPVRDARHILGYLSARQENARLHAGFGQETPSILAATHTDSDRDDEWLWQGLGDNGVQDPTTVLRPRMSTIKAHEDQRTQQIHPSASTWNVPSFTSAASVSATQAPTPTTAPLPRSEVSANATRTHSINFATNLPTCLSQSSLPSVEELEKRLDLL